MTNATQTILVVDPNAETRAILARQLSENGCSVFEAADGTSALQIVRDREIGLVVSELYLKTGESDCLIQAIRRNRVRGTRTLAHTVFSKRPDRAWAKQWGASGYLIQPARTERLRHAVSLLLKPRVQGSAGKASRISRRNTLDVALAEIESGALQGTSSIVFGGTWWHSLTARQRNDYRNRARRAELSLRSDRMMGQDFVELRGAVSPGKSRKSRSKASKASPYRP